jgi:hypothetical protein
VISDADLAEVSRQLGRPARDMVEVSARCVCSRPLVVKTRPRLEDGTPFPTLYYLTQPSATAAVSTLEASGVMAQFQQQLAEDEELAAAYQAAHESFLAEREDIEVVAEIAGISAGGMPTRVKCLHSLVAHSLAKGPGVNPIGDASLKFLSWSPEVCTCV